MGLLRIDGVTHWSIPVNNLREAERFYGDVLGLQYEGRLGNSGMCRFTVGGHSILLCQRREPVMRSPEQANRLHHSFTVSPESWVPSRPRAKAAGNTGTPTARSGASRGKP